MMALGKARLHAETKTVERYKYIKRFNIRHFGKKHTNDDETGVERD